jgi:hypothetical protein
MMHENDAVAVNDKYLRGVRPLKGFAKLICTMAICGSIFCCTKNQPPPNAPAAISGTPGKGAIHLFYHKGNLAAFDIRVEENGSLRKPARGEVEMKTFTTTGEVVEQRITLSLNSGDNKLVVFGNIHGSAESFPAETFGEAQKTFPVVRNSVGLSWNTRNNAI